MRHASSAWGAGYAGHLESVGFVGGRSAPTVLYNSEWECKLVVHSNDSKFLRPRRVVERVVSMKGWYDIKPGATFGGGPNTTLTHRWPS